MRIYHFEDEEDLKVLRSANVDVEPDEDLTETVELMFGLMRHANGIGLAAPQVGINKRFFVIEVKRGQRLVLINPELVFTSVEMVTNEEGCLSLAGLYDKVERPAHIKMQATNLAGKVFTIEAEGLMAVCLQHELDHLNGKLFIDHLSEHRLEKAMKHYAKIVKRTQK